MLGIRFRFSLKALFALFIVLSIPFGWIGFHLDQNRSDLVISEQLEHQGIHTHRGSASDIEEWPVIDHGNVFPNRMVTIVADSTESTTFLKRLTDKIIHVEAERKTIDEHTQVEIGRLRSLQSLELYECRIADGLLCSRHIPRDIRWLNLHSSVVARDDLSCIAELEKLEWLDIGNCNANDGDIDAITGLCKLRVLNLSDNRLISDSGASQLKNMHGLQIVRLNGTSIGDEGLYAIAESESVNHIEVIRTRVTAEGVLRTNQRVNKRGGKLTITWDDPQ